MLWESHPPSQVLCVAFTAVEALGCVPICLNWPRSPARRCNCGKLSTLLVEYRCAYLLPALLPPHTGYVCGISRGGSGHIHLQISKYVAIDRAGACMCLLGEAGTAYTWKRAGGNAQPQLYMAQGCLCQYLVSHDATTVVVFVNSSWHEQMCLQSPQKQSQQRERCTVGSVSSAECVS